MRFLTSKFTVHNFKALTIALSPLLAAILGILITIKSPSTQSAIAQTPEPDAACIAAGLSRYMDAIVDARKADPASFANIRLLSPAFNITSNLEAQIFDNMVAGVGGISGNFNDIDGFAANTYSHVPGQGSNYQAYSNWYAQQIYGSPLKSWKERFTGHPTYFTEFGDYDYNSGNRSANIAAVQQQHTFASQDEQVDSINYFDALGGNPEFAARHQLSSGEYHQITGSHSGEAGVNSAMPVNISFPEQIVSTYGGGSAGWAVQISYSKGDKDLVEEYVRQAYQRGIKPILRICAGNTCDFANVKDYINFLKSLELVGPLYVLAGPNEPGTELWATPECIRQRPLELHNVECNAITNPDFHSLRPYPANPCNKIPSGTTQCGNDLVVNETIEVTPAQGHNCINNPDGGRHCDFTVQSTAVTTVDLSRAQLPIVGNTQLVPNSVNTTSSLSFDQRVTDYLSWYLNGVVQRAEERFFSFPSDAGLLLNFSGPLRKILPFAIQNGAYRVTSYLLGIPNTTQLDKGLRLKQADDIGTQRHNQTVVCGDQDNPEACYSQNQDNKRLDAVAFTNTHGPQGQVGVYPNQSLDYIPFSSTEDRVGVANLVPTGAAFTSGDVAISGLTLTPSQGAAIPKNLYFAHMQESIELGDATQKTFVPKDFIGSLSQEKTDDITRPQLQAGCVINDTRTNAGDDLYADAVKDGVAEPPLKGDLSYTADFSCDFSPTIDQTLYYQCMGAGFCTVSASCGGTFYSDPNCATGLGRCILPPPAPGDFSNAGCAAYATTIASTCQKQISIPLQVLTKTPEAESVWNQYVAGAWSIFRRFFPKVGPGTPVAKIQDIPAETVASYDATSQGATGGTLISTSALAGVNKSGSNANIYFPHIGSISDYFLNGIQEALHPYGMGPKTLINNGSTVPGDGSNPNPGQCTLSGSGFASQILQEITIQAANWAHVPVQLLVTVIHGEACRGGGPLCTASDADVASWSVPGGQLPYNCSGTISGGPLGFYDWSKFANAVNMATGENRTPNVCNVKDAIYAAAYVLSSAYTSNPNAVACSHVPYDVASAPAASSWTPESMLQVLQQAWVCGCHDLASCDPNGKAIATTVYPPILNQYSNVTSVCTGSGTNPAKGLCSPENLRPYFGDNTGVMSCICNNESGGVPILKNDSCLRGGTVDYSIGLFQINLLVHPDYSQVPPELRQQFVAAGVPNAQTVSCHDAFGTSYYDKIKLPCKIRPGYEELVRICENWFYDPVHNINYAQYLLKQPNALSTHWGADAGTCF